MTGVGEIELTGKTALTVAQQVLTMKLVGRTNDWQKKKRNGSVPLKP